MNKAIITGGGGFVGKAIIKILLRQGVECQVLGRSDYPELEALGIQCFRGDIYDREFILQHLTNCNVVFHVAALAGIWGQWQEYYTINVQGTQNIIDGCLLNGIPALVHTSTPSVVFDREDIINGDETLPYASQFLCGYAKSKAMAEKLALSVDQEVLKTCAIRPHLIWGPGDPHLVPRLLERGRKGTLKIVGDGTNKVDITYIDNVAQAHFLAAQNLISSASASGKAYFIGQERPVRMWQWINDLFKRMDVPPVTGKVSLPAARTAGSLLETTHRLMRRAGEPKMTRFLAEQLARSHYFSHDRAQQDFGYLPVVSIEEGMDKLIHWLKEK